MGSFLGVLFAKTALAGSVMRLEWVRFVFLQLWLGLPPPGDSISLADASRLSELSKNAPCGYW
jgi:hypothetical protein